MVISNQDSHISFDLSFGITSLIHYSCFKVDCVKKISTINSVTEL